MVPLILVQFGVLIETSIVISDQKWKSSCDSYLLAFIVLILEWCMLMIDTTIFFGIPLFRFLSDLYLSFMEFENY